MIRYRRLYESDNQDVKLYDVVKCGGYKWFVIGMEGDIVTLLTLYTIEELTFNSHINYTNDYKDSKIRRYLETRILPKLEKNNVNPISTRLFDVNCNDKVWLLSVDEAAKLPLKVLRAESWWWLRTPGKNVALVSFVSQDGEINTIGESDWGGIRPAMRVRIDNLD